MFIHTNGIVVVDFYATWCSLCKVLAPILTEVSNSLGISIHKFNIDNSNKIILETFNIISIPTVIIFEDGKVKDRLIGLTTKEKLLSKIKNG